MKIEAPRRLVSPADQRLIVPPTVDPMAAARLNGAIESAATAYRLKCNFPPTAEALDRSLEIVTAAVNAILPEESRMPKTTAGAGDLVARAMARRESFRQQAGQTIVDLGRPAEPGSEQTVAALLAIPWTRVTAARNALEKFSTSPHQPPEVIQLMGDYQTRRDLLPLVARAILDRVTAEGAEISDRISPERLSPINQARLSRGPVASVESLRTRDELLNWLYLTPAQLNSLAEAIVVHGGVLPPQARQALAVGLTEQLRLQADAAAPAMIADMFDQLEITAINWRRSPASRQFESPRGLRKLLSMFDLFPTAPPGAIFSSDPDTIAAAAAGGEMHLFQSAEVVGGQAIPTLSVLVVAENLLRRAEAEETPLKHQVQAGIAAWGDYRRVVDGNPKRIGLAGQKLAAIKLSPEVRTLLDNPLFSIETPADIARRLEAGGALTKADLEMFLQTKDLLDKVASLRGQVGANSRALIRHQQALESDMARRVKSQSLSEAVEVNDEQLALMILGRRQSEIQETTRSLRLRAEMLANTIAQTNWTARLGQWSGIPALLPSVDNPEAVKDILGKAQAWRNELIANPDAALPSSVKIPFNHQLVIDHLDQLTSRLSPKSASTRRLKLLRAIKTLAIKSPADPGRMPGRIIAEDLGREIRRLEELAETATRIEVLERESRIIAQAEETEVLPPKQEIRWLLKADPGLDQRRGSHVEKIKLVPEAVRSSPWKYNYDLDKAEELIAAWVKTKTVSLEIPAPEEILAAINQLMPTQGEKQPVPPAVASRTQKAESFLTAFRLTVASSNVFVPAAEATGMQINTLMKAVKTRVAVVRAIREIPELEKRLAADRTLLDSARQTQQQFTIAAQAKAIMANMERLQRELDGAQAKFLSRMAVAGLTLDPEVLKGPR